MEAGEGSDEAEAASIVGMQEVRTEEPYLLAQQAYGLEVYHLVEDALRDGGTVAQYEVAAVHLYVGHAIVGRQVAAEQVEKQYFTASLAEGTYPAKGMDAVGVGEEQYFHWSLSMRCMISMGCSA